MTAATHRLEFFADVNAFLGEASDYLAERPVLSTVIATMAARAVADGVTGAGTPSDVPAWWLVVRDGHGHVVSAAMRTAPFAPYPAFLLPMPAAAALVLAREVHGRGETLGGLNGSRPAVDVVASELARLTGGSTSVAQHTRLFELGELVEPSPPPGALCVAEQDDAQLVWEWWDAFRRDADEQAGRPPGSLAEHTPDLASLVRRIEAGQIRLWIDEAGDRVHFTAANPPSFGVARIGPVYTPPYARGRGYASAAVGQVSRVIRDSGSQACLFTDQANPTSNHIYTDLGYRPVVDMANLQIS